MNKKEILVICLIILCIFCSISAVASADVGSDGTNGTMSSASVDDVVSASNGLSSYSLPNSNQQLRGENDGAGSFSNLRDDIGTAGGTIVLAKNYTYNSTTDSALSQTGVVLQGTYTIEGEAGKNITINGLGMSKLFTLNGTIKLKNINFIRGSSFEDSPIHSNGTLTIEDCNFSSCRGMYGGAIHAVGGLTISGSHFNDNMAINDGGSLYIADSSLTSIVSDSTFKNDKALTGNGGSIYSATSLLTLRNLSFTGCFANNNGGAIMLSGHNTTLDNVNISGCNATLNGGAIYFRHNHKLLSNLRFENNRADFGGAIYCYPECEGIDDGGLINVTFIGNKAIEDGGAMHVSGDNGKMTNATFKNNIANGDGGAMFINGTGWRVYNSTFDVNTAKNDGGAISVNSGTGIMIVYSNFTSNHAERGNGGAINCYNNTNNGVVNHSRFISNIAYSGDGGAIYWDGNHSAINDSYFKENYVTIGTDVGFGGAVSLSGSYNNITNCTFTRNNAAVNGGAVVIKNKASLSNSTNTTVRDSIFEYNDAGRNGGAIYWNPNCYNATVINSTFRHNTASGSAGALGMQSDYGYVFNSTFEFNEAFGTVSNEHPGNGGAMTFVGNHNYAYNCTFTNNTAANHGGAAYVKSTAVKNNNDTTFELCNFTNNTAKKNGGAVDWSAGSINGNIFNSTFINNTAWRSGGAVHWSGTYGEILYSSFTTNKALGDIVDENGGGDGGAVIWLGSHGTVDHCNFTDNFAQYRGGAVFLKGASTSVHSNDTNFTWCRFINNTAGLNGGAVDWQSGANNGRLVHGVFINNTAWRSGGAVFWYGTNGTVDDCNFTDNKAIGNVTKDDRKALGITYTTVGGNGGAIVWTGSTGKITKANFDDNYAKCLGGAIFLELNENVTISHANFTNNWADINGGAIDWYKGAANGRVEHVKFINNIAKRSGGAIYWYGHNGTLYDVTFINNTALGNASYINPFGENTTGGDGGAIFWTGYDGNVTVSKFINNTAAKRGGAVFLQGTTDYYCNNTRFKTALFENNTAGTNGGAVDWFKGATHGSIDNATFKNNVANRSGGAVYWYGDYGDILNSNFTNNTAKGMTWAINAYGVNTTGGSGGAVIWSGSHGEVYNCRFIDNNASKHGGAVYMQGTSEENCTNTTFDLCYFEGNNATINGGAIDWHENAHDGLVNNSFFTNNRARANGGAIFWEGHHGDILNSNFTYNYALGIVSDDEGNQGDGGAVIWGGINGDVENCWFKFNNASGRGGAVYIHSCSHGNNNTTFVNSHFINNTAKKNGGAIDWHAGAKHGLVNRTEFINNTAGVDGGAIYWNGNNGTVADSNFTNNTAQESGGAIYWQGYYGIINGTRFEDNKAVGLGDGSLISTTENPKIPGKMENRYNITGGDGGAIKWTGSHGIIENSTFYRNNATYNGGAIYLVRVSETENCTNITFIDCNFTENLAKLNGGAVFWDEGASNATVKGSHFINNTASRTAGAIYIKGNNLEIKDTEFKFNDAALAQTYDNRTGSGYFSSVGGNGGAICWMGSYGTLDNASFINNTACDRGGAIQFEDNENATIKCSRFINNSAGTEGGAIDFYTGAKNGKIIDSNFTNNTAQENAGAIFWKGYNGIINGSRFEANKAIGLGDGRLLSTTDNPKIAGTQTEKRYNITGGDGGAIKWIGSDAIIENTTFYRNNATYNGGAIYLVRPSATENCTNITFIDCNFTENLAKLNGGAVFWDEGASNATVKCSHFINNTASRTAGAIYIKGDYLEIKDTEFKFNDAALAQTYDNRTGSGYFSSVGGNGGAICWMGSYGTLDNASFINNTARERGGAIQFENNINGTVKNSLFENNSAHGDGGAIDWYTGAENGQLLNSTFRTNYIVYDSAIDTVHGRGSGVYINGTNTTIKDSRFYRHNTDADGGVIYIDGDNSTVDNSTFEHIYSILRGGAIFVAGDNTTISASNFTDVHADSDGGAIYVTGENTNITGSKFNKTYSKANGGSFYITGKNTAISQCNFTDSDASVSGGAVYVAGRNTNITLSDFKSCQSNGTAATNGGGAIYVKDAYDTNILNSTFKDCSASNRAGAIYVDGHRTTIDYSNFTSNTATHGGAIYITGDRTNVTHSNFTSNIADNTKGLAGAIYVSGTNGHNNISFCTFDKNEAFKAGAVYANGPYTSFEYSNFTSNRAHSGDNGKGSGAAGAAFIEGADSSLKYCNFDQNRAGGNGGAVVWKGGYAGSKFIGCNFTKNYITTSNSLGGAVYFTSGGNVPASIRDCRFEENHGPRHGGAINWYGASDGLIDNCTFIKNYCTGGDGGALYCGDTSSAANHLTVSNCTFSENYASFGRGAGGAISNQMKECTFVNCTFTKNHARYGGAIVMKDSVAASSQIINCTFEDCYANLKNIENGYQTNGGGALFLRDYNITIADSTFINCSASTGGAIRMTGDHSIKWAVSANSKLGKDCVIDNCTFINCSAGNGGAVHWDGINGKVANSTFTNNTGTFVGGNGVTYTGNGAAVYWAQFADANGGLNGEIYNCTFENNNYDASNGKGGAVFWEASNGHIYNSTFKNNSAVNGGAVYWNLKESTSRGNNGTVNNCTFENNSASAGGAVYFNMNDAKLYDSNFTSNSATNGGSVYLNNGYQNRMVDNCTFTNGSSKEYGGDMYVKGTSVTVSNITSTNASAYEGGSIALIGANNDEFTNITIIKANATNGGGIFIDKDSQSNDFTIISITNSTGVNGGGIFIVGKSNTIDNLTLVNNFATNGGSVYVVNKYKQYSDLGSNNKLTNVTANNSTASNNGGAIYWAAKDGNITLILVKNSNALNGGALFVESTADNLQVTDATFTNNNATNGGAVYWKGTNGVLDNAEFTENHATKGGAVYWAESSSKFTNTEFYYNTATDGGAVYWNTNGGSIVNTTMKYNRAVNGSAIYAAQTINDVINAILLNNQAHSHEIYNPDTTTIQRVGDTIEVFTYFRGKDNILNAIHNIGGDMYFTNVTYLGVGGERNTGDTRRKPVVLADGEVPTDETGYEIYQTNLEVYQDITTYVYDRYNKIAVNMTNLKTDYRGAISFKYSNETLLADLLNIKMFHPEDDYYTYIAFSNRTKLPGVVVEAKDIYFHDIEILNITLWSLNETDTDIPSGNITLYLNGEIYYNITVDSEGNKHYNPWVVDDTGHVSVPVPGLHVGHYEVYVAYSGDGKFVPEYNSTSFNVLMINSTINVTIPSYYYGDKQKVIIRTIENASNNISVILNGQQYWIEVNDTGYAELEVPLLNAGNYTVEAYYPETRDCYASRNSTAFEVWKVNSTINITGTYNDNFNTVTLHVDVGPSDTYGNVVVTFNGKDYELSLTNSSAELTIMHVPRGEYIANATYGGDMNHWGSNNTTLIKALKFATPIIIDVTNITYGENETIVIHMSANATGNLTITFNGRTFNETIVNGTVTLANLTLAAGDYPIYVSYAGDDNYAQSRNQTIFNVAKAIPVLEPVVENITYLDIEHIIANINQTGNVSIIIRSLIDPSIIITQNLTINITNKHNVTWNISGLARGDYIAQFIFSGNQNYTGCEVNATFIVGYATPIIIVEVNDTKVDRDVPINITVYPRGNVTGNVSVYVDGIKIGDYTLVDGFVRITGEVSNLINGTHDVVAVYNGDGNFTHAHNSTTFNVTKYDPKFNVTALNVTVLQNGRITINLPANATGMVYIKVNETQYYVNLSVSRVLDLPLLGNGTYVVTANYTGDGYWNSAVNATTFNVTKVNTTVDINVIQPVVYDIYTNITVTVINGVDGFITLTINNGTHNISDITLPVVDGKVNWIKEGLAAGSYRVYANYTGSARYNLNDTQSKAFTVGQATPAFSVDVVRVNSTTNATVKVKVNDTMTGTLNITVYNKNYTADIIDGVATFTIDKLPVGQHDVNVTYAGNTNYTYKSQVFENRVIVTKATCYPINVTAVDVLVGVNTTITVHVPKDATGNVTIWVNGTKKVNTTIVDGVATFHLNKTVSGKYVVNATLSDPKYANKTAYTNYWVSEYLTPIRIDVDPIYVGDIAVINVTAPAGIKNNVTIEIDGVAYNKSVDANGMAQFEVQIWSNGTRTVVASYGGDNKYLSNSTTANFTVSKRVSDLVAVATGSSVGGNATITVQVQRNATGYVTVNVNGTNYSIKLNSTGGGALNVTGLGNGTYSVHATYLGDRQYLPDTDDKTFEMTMLNTTMTISVESIDYTQKANITVTVRSDATGFITIRINNTRNITLPIVKGKVNWIVDNLAADKYAVYANYSGDGKYNINSTDKVNRSFEVRQITPVITIEPVEVSSARNATVVVHITPGTTGNINITVNGQNYSGPIENGVARIIIKQLNVGNYTVTANYSGDKNFTNASTVQINKVNVHKFACYDMNVTAPDTIVGVNTTIVVNVPEDAKGNVSIYVNGKFVDNATITQGVAKLNVTQNTAGKYVVNATFTDGKYANKTVTTNYHVLNADTPIEISVDPIYVGDIAVIDVTVPKGVINNVTIEIDGVSYNKSVDVNGKARFEVQIWSNGTRTVVASYGGDNKYLSNSTTANFTVSKRNSQVNVTASATVVGMDAVINVTVPANATGYVIVNINGTNYTINTTNGNGSLVIKKLGNGHYTVNVTYIGDNQYFESTNSTDFTILRIQPTFKVNGTNITYGAKELIKFESVENITAPITVEINGTNYTAFIIEGKGNLTVENLAAGKYNVTIYFDGNCKYMNATANNTFTVNKATIPIIVVPQNITFGDREVVTVYVNATGFISITVDHITYSNLEIKGGKVEFELLGYLYADNYTAYVTYSGNQNYTGNSAEANFTVAKKDPAITIEVQNITYGDVEHIIVRVNAKGNVTIKVNGTEENIVLREDDTAIVILRFTTNDLPKFDGRAHEYLYNLNAGMYPVEVIYYGNENYNGANAKALFFVSKDNTTAHVEVDDIMVGGKEVINVTISNANVTGNVTINVDGVNYTRPLVNGTANLTLTDLPAGNHSVVVIYRGDNNFRGNWTSATFNVTKVKPGLTIDVNDTSAGKTAKIIVNLPDNATGFVVIDVDGTKYHVDIVPGQEIALEVDNLLNKTYHVTAEYSGDEYWDTADNSASFNVNITKADISVKVENITVGDKAIINITTPKELYGNVTVTVDGENYTVYVAGGNGILVVPGLDVGNYTVNVNFAGNDRFGPNNATTELKVSKVNVTSDDIKVIDQGNGTVVVVVGGNATGNVTVYVDGQNFTGEVINGTAVITLDNVTPGVQNITAVYSGDATHTNVTVNGTVTIPKLDTGLIVTVVPGIEGENTTITVKVPGNATGNVTVTIDGQKYTAEIDNGTAVFTVENLTAGNKTALIEYSGDANYTANYTTSNFTVGEAKIVPDIRVVDQGNGTVVVIVGGNATGNVTIYVGGQNFTGEVINGTAVVPLNNLTPGVNDIEVVYSGDDTHTNATVNSTVAGSKYNTPITVNVTQVTEGETAVVTVTVPENATGNVTVTIDGKQFTGEIINGTATIPVANLTAGEKSVIVEYIGDDNYASNYTVGNFTVDKAKVIPDIKVVDQGNGTVVVVVGGNATGNVTIYVDGQNFTGEVINGTAVITLDNVTPGVKDIEVVYSGDDTHTNSTINSTVTYPKYDSPITVNVTEVTEGETAVVTVTVPENATGNVTVTIDGKQFTGEIINGTATIPVANLTAGDKSVIVEYIGDDNYASNYTVGNFTVDAAKIVPDIRVVDQGNGTVVIIVGGNATGNVTVKLGNDTYIADVINGTATLTLDNLTPGKNDIEVIYSGDDTHTNSTIDSIVSGPKYDTPITVNVTEVTEGETAIITVTVPENATGNVTVTIDGVKYTAEVINGTATIPVDNLTAGDKSVIVEYVCDDNYASNYTVGNFTVDRAKDISEVYVVDQGNGTVVVVVPNNATGNVTVKVGNDTYTAEVINGTATIALDNLTPGVNGIEVIYSGDASHTNATVNTTVTGPKYDTPIEVITVPGGVGEDTQITVKVPEGATGNVTIEIDGVKYTTEIIDGNATFTISNLTEGTKTVAVEYAGDGKYAGGHTTANVTVSKVKSYVSATIVDINVGENVTIIVNVPDDATGQVLIDIDGVGYYVNVTNGTGTAQIPRMPSGIYPVNLTYIGDDRYLPSSNYSVFDVNKIPSYVIPTAKNIAVGKNEIIVFEVPKDATGNLTIIIDGKEFVFDLDEILGVPIYSDGKFSVAVSDGQGVLVLSGLPVGKYNVTVTYNGNYKYLKSTNTTTFTVSEKDSEITVVDQGDGTVKVYVSDNATGNVTIKVGNDTYTAEVIDGVATINLENVSAGTHDIEVEYSGDGTHSPKTVESSVTIPKKSTPISVTAHDIYVGDTEHIVVTVPEGATGIISIEINAMQYNATIENGKAVFDVTGLTFGNKTVAVTYWGDVNYVENFTTGQFEVKKCPSTVDATSKNIKAGKDEPIKVVVPDDATGRVTVTIEGVDYSGKIVKGRVTVVVPNLPAGKYKAQVTYEGDDKYMPSTTTTTFEVIKTATPISATGDDIEYGDDGTVVVKIPEDATGIVEITVEGKKYKAKVFKGKATFKVPGLEKGVHKVKVHYYGDSKYDANETVTEIIVKGDTPDPYHGEGHKSNIGGIVLSGYETGNPVLVLLLILLTICTTQLRRFKR